MPRYLKIDISHKTIFFITGFIALLWALYQIREVIILLFIAIIFMSALKPVIESLQKLKVPKSLAIAFSYIVVFAIMFSLLYLITIPFIEQTTNLIQNLPSKVQQLLPEEGPINRSIVQDELTTISKNALSFTLALFNNFIAFISIAVLTFYLLLERERL